MEVVLAKAIKYALEEAGIKPEDVDYINAHGTSTPANDGGETAAIKLALGEYANKVAISSSKSMTGHLLGAAGAIEAIVCVKAIEENFAPPTINYEHQTRHVTLTMYLMWAEVWKLNTPFQTHWALVDITPYYALKNGRADTNEF